MHLKSKCQSMPIAMNKPGMKQMKKKMKKKMRKM